MEAMRQSWSDDRLDHLNERVDAGFRRVDQRFDEVIERFDRRLEGVDRRLDQVDDRLGKLEDRHFHAMRRTLIQVFGAFIGTLILASGGIIASLN
jgi:hypothetical protein